MVDRPPNRNDGKQARVRIVDRDGNESRNFIHQEMGPDSRGTSIATRAVGSKRDDGSMYRTGEYLRDMDMVYEGVAARRKRRK